MDKRSLVFASAAGAFLLLSVYLYHYQLYMALSYCLWVLIFMSLMAFVTHRKLDAEEIIIMAALAAIAAVGRTIFAPLPSIQPVSFIVICTAVVFGWRTGLMVGMLSAFVSNLFLGQGPWTLWQMLAWGLMGLTAGLLFYKRNHSKAAKMIFGFIAGIMFGWIMNLWYLVSYIDSVSWAGILLAYGASFFMDLLHGLSNVVFIALFADSLEKILIRIRNKYGILDRA